MERKASFASAVRSGDRLRMLKAQRHRLAEELDIIELGANPSGVATLMRQMNAVADKIAALEQDAGTGSGGVKKGDPLDELAERRRKRRTDSAPEGEQPRLLG